MATDFSTTQIVTMLPVAVFACLTISIFGTLMVCLINRFSENHRKKANKHRMRAVVRGDIRSYEDYLLHQLNIGRKDNYILNYQDYLVQKLNSPRRH